jgi:hypothetical protein
VPSTPITMARFHRRRCKSGLEDAWAKKRGAG